MGDADIDALFKLPLADFTPARNELAARLKKQGQADAAAEVKRLAKPSVSAWVVNQLFWNHRKLFDRLMESGQQIRRMQSAQIAGGTGDVRDALDARREAMTALTKEAAGLLEGASHTASPEMMRRISTTLEALSTYGDAAGAPAPGRLTEDVDPPGFDALAALIPAGGGGANRGPSTVLPFKKKAARAAPAKAPADPKEAKRLEREREARRAAAIKEAERAVRDARAAAERAEAALKKAAARVKTAETAKEDAERRLEAAAAELTAAKAEARQVAAEAEDAAQAVSDAERALERARSDAS